MPDIMAYYTWSQGFRPGLLQPFVRLPCPDPTTKINLYCIPLKIAPDSLTNNELGWKTEFFDHRLQFNGAHLPGELDQRPGGSSIRVCSASRLRHERAELPRARRREALVIARDTGLDRTGAAASWNNSEQTNSRRSLRTIRRC